MVSVGRILKDHPNPLPWAGMPPADQIAHSPIQPCLEHLQGWVKVCYQLSEACSQGDKRFQSAKVNTGTITACWGGTGLSDWATRTTTKRVNSKRNTQESTGLVCQQAQLNAYLYSKRFRPPKPLSESCSGAHLGKESIIQHQNRK